MLDAPDTAVTIGGDAALEGAKALAATVRARLPGLAGHADPACSPASCSPRVTGAPRMDLAIENPDLDRHDARRVTASVVPGCGVSAGSRSAGITRAALDEAVTAAERGWSRPRDAAHGAVDRARAAVHERRDVERRAEETAQHARSAHDRFPGRERTLPGGSERGADRAQELEVTGGPHRAAGGSSSAERGRIACGEARAPQLEAANRRGRAPVRGASRGAGAVSRPVRHRACAASGA